MKWSSGSVSLGREMNDLRVGLMVYSLGAPLTSILFQQLVVTLHSTFSYDDRLSKLF